MFQYRRENGEVDGITDSQVFTDFLAVYSVYTPILIRAI